MSNTSSGATPGHAGLDAWRKAAAKSAPGGAVDALTWTTPEGIQVKPLYTREDLVGG